MERSVQNQDFERSRQQIFSQDLKVVNVPAAGREQAGFTPLHLRCLTHLPQKRFPLFLKGIRKDSREISFVPFVAPEEELAADWLAQLKKLGISQVYIPQNEVEKVVEVLAAHLTYLEKNEEGLSKPQLELFYDQLYLSLEWAASSPQLEAQIPQVIDQAERIIKKFDKNRLPFHLIWESMVRDYSLFRHSLNVFFIAVGFLYYMKYKRIDCQNVGVAALFHDVGMLQIPENIRSKFLHINSYEMVELKKHPQLSHSMLKQYRQFPPVALQLVLEHHENADGSGYPQGLDIRRQNPFTRIIRLADAYETLTSHRPSLPGSTPFAALSSMKNQVGRHCLVFDHDLLNRFITFIGS
jgi:response regulator RpfG family c-di-GMP phosphodiesterase